jgi:GAF domain-containing protein
VRHDNVPKVYDPDWKYEPLSLPDRDPMFAAALQAQPSLFVNDVETASPEVVNREFEAETFGHRALIHAHLCIERKLWGILQACTFDQPREWSRSDRQLIEQAVGWFAPCAMEYVNRYAPTPEHC